MGISQGPLEATIKNVGLLHNLIALQLLSSQGSYQPDHLIPVKHVSEELARAASMVENSEREDMHPEELIAGFKALSDEEKIPAQIGDLMGFSSRHGQRCPEFTGLTPAILETLAATSITIEQCQALTLTDSRERLLEV